MNTLLLALAAAVLVRAIAPVPAQKRPATLSELWKRLDADGDALLTVPELRLNMAQIRLWTTSNQRSRTKRRRRPSKSKWMSQ